MSITQTKTENRYRPDGAVTTGRYPGRSYTLKHRRHCDIVEWSDSKMLRWFLWIGDASGVDNERDYAGDFPTRRAALLFLREELNGREVI